MSLFLELLEQRGLHGRPLTLRVASEHVRAYSLDLADLLFIGGADQVLLYSLEPNVDLDEETAGFLEEIVLASGHRDRLKLLEYSTATEEGLRCVGQIAKMIPVCRMELGAIRKSEPLKRFLTRSFVSTTALSSLNPYTYRGPVTGNRFFGRDSELATLRLQAGKSFVISGVRRSGKSSLMMEFVRRLRTADPASDLAVFVNFETCVTPGDIPYMLLVALAEQTKNAPGLSQSSHDLLRLAQSRLWRSTSNIPRLANTIWKIIASQGGSRRIRFFFDEYDRVVVMERNLDYVITRTWRDLLMRPMTHSGQAFAGSLQFTFAGARNLYEEILSNSSPLYNLAVQLKLPNFDLKTLGDLVTRPMQEIGVVVRDPASVAQAILSITGGHPATSQHLCSLLVDDPHTERTREVSVGDVHRAARTPQFLGAFKNTIERNLPPLGRFILAQMAINARDKVNMHFIRAVSRNNRVQLAETTVGVALEELADSGFLRAVDFAAGHTVYRLEVPIVPVLFSRADTEDLIADMLAEGICQRT